jgi:hypothetical protein
VRRGAASTLPKVVENSLLYDTDQIERLRNCAPGAKKRGAGETASASSHDRKANVGFPLWALGKGISQMALKGAREPVQGVRGAKAKLRLPKIPRQPETSETVALREEYLRKRNKILELKYKRESMNLAFDRGELVERSLVEKQLGFLLIAMRQKLLPIPSKLAARFGPEAFPREMFDVATVFIAEALREVAELPTKGVDPDWLEKLEEDDG